MTRSRFATALAIGVVAAGAPVTLVAAERGDAGPGAATMQPVRGVLKAVEIATYVTDLQASVVAIGFREGEHFKAGDTLVTFDCRRLEAALAALEATEREMQVTLASNEILAKRAAANRNDVEIARARADKAGSEAYGLRVRVAECVVQAPFDGSVVELLVNAHETPATARPYLTIIGARAPEVELIVPSRWLGNVKPGDQLTFSIDETGETHPMTLLRLGTLVDPVSQTVKLYGRLDGAADVVAGMSGTAYFGAADR